MECLREFHESFHVLTHKFLVLPKKKLLIKWYVVNHKKGSFALKTDFQSATTTTLLHPRVRIENSAKLLNQEKQKLIGVLSSRNNLTSWASGLRADPQYKGLGADPCWKGLGVCHCFSDSRLLVVVNILTTWYLLVPYPLQIFHWLALLKAFPKLPRGRGNARAGALIMRAWW